MNRREMLEKARENRENQEDIIAFLNTEGEDYESVHKEVRAARSQVHHKQEVIEEQDEKIQGLECELEDKRATIRDLKEQREAQELALEAERDRVEKKENEIELLKNQLKSTMSQNLANAEEFNWHGMMKTEQYWRPPYHEEIMDLGKYLEWNMTGDFSTDFSEDTKFALHNSYVVVLDHYVSDSPAYAGKLMFVVHGLPSFNTTFIWDEHGLMPVSEASETREQHYNFLDERPNSNE